jgi:cytochrome c-type biogenesis protein CcmH
MRYLIVLLALACVPLGAYALDTNQLPTPALQKRYDALTQGFRCLVCQDESIAVSNADLAVELRDRVRKLLLEGKSDKDIVDYMVARYGNFVLYKPPLQANTLALWFGPAVLLVIAIGAVVVIVRRRATMDNERESAA